MKYTIHAICRSAYSTTFITFLLYLVSVSLSFPVSLTQSPSTHHQHHQSSVIAPQWTHVRDVGNDWAIPSTHRDNDWTVKVRALVHQITMKNLTPTEMICIQASRMCGLRRPQLWKMLIIIQSRFCTSSTSRNDTERRFFYKAVPKIGDAVTTAARCNNNWICKLHWLPLSYKRNTSKTAKE